MLVSRFLARDGSRTSRPSGECNRLTAEIGEKAAVIVNIRNTGGCRSPGCSSKTCCRARCYAASAADRYRGEADHILHAGGPGRKTLLYQLHFAMRGYYQVGPLVLETGDLFGLHRRFRS